MKNQSGREFGEEVKDGREFGDSAKR